MTVLKARGLRSSAQEVAGGVVHQARERPELLLQVGDRGLDRVRVSHVGARPRGAAAELSDRLLQGGGPPTQDAHAGSGVVEGLDHGAAQPGAASGDEEGLAVQGVAGEHEGS